MSEKDLMLRGYLYNSTVDEFTGMKTRRAEFNDAFNATSHTDHEARVALLHEYLGKVGRNVWINKPFYCDYGSHIYLGDNFYANFDCIMLDVNEIRIGNNVMLGPRVCIYTAGHPIDKDIRNELLEYGYKVTIGDDVWIGGNTVINPGVTIGSNVVIGSGSVVTKDIPSNVVAAGNPCRVIRPIKEKDKVYWEGEKTKRLRSGLL